MDKIVFLDIDGVLNNVSTRPRDPRNLGDWIDDRNLIVANELLVRTGAAVVVSSSWRHGRDSTTLDRTLAARGFVGDVVDLTPVLPGRPRWMEIHAWLGSRRTEAYVILDDVADMGGLAHRHVCPSSLNGLTQEDLAPAISCLGGEVDAPVLFFRAAQRPFGVLSNFSRHPVVLDGAVYPTAEHAYQAQKLAPGPERAAVTAAPTPHEAKTAAASTGPPGARTGTTSRTTSCARSWRRSSGPIRWRWAYCSRRACDRSQRPHRTTPTGASGPTARAAAASARC